jgi:Zn-dependent protease with chaperone function
VALVLIVVVGGVVLVFALSYWFVVLALVAAPYPLAAVARRAELRADQHAAALGFGPMRAEVLQTTYTQESEIGRGMTAAFAGRDRTDVFGVVLPVRGGRPVPLSKLLASHPAHHTRLHHLAPYLGRRRR